MGTDLYNQPGIEPNFNLLNPSPTVPRVIGLSGYAQSGKDTVGNIIARLYGHRRTSPSDVLREFLYAQDLFLPDGQRLNDLVDEVGWEEARRQEPWIRVLQQHTGTEAGRNILGPDVWTRVMFKRYTAGGLIVDSSVRFENEAANVKAAGGVMLRVIRPGVRPVNSHASDTALDHYAFDDIIVNDGDLLDLEGEVQRVLGEFDGPQ